jgi:hypothetical protein
MNDDRYAHLDALCDALDGISLMTQRMADVAKKCDALGLAFAAEMLIESTEVFRDEITRFVVERDVS